MIDRILDWMGEHPLIVIVLFIICYFGGCNIAIHVGIVNEHTKLMPY